MDTTNTILQHGGLDKICHRVVVDAEGHAVLPWRAADYHGVSPDVAFVRDDGWTLGAPAKFEGVAYGLWKEEWVSFARRGDDRIRPIREYERHDL